MAAEPTTSATDSSDNNDDDDHDNVDMEEPKQLDDDSVKVTVVSKHHVSRKSSRNKPLPVALDFLADTFARIAVDPLADEVGEKSTTQSPSSETTRSRDDELLGRSPGVKSRLLTMSVEKLPSRKKPRNL